MGRDPLQKKNDWLGCTLDNKNELVTTYPAVITNIHKMADSDNDSDISDDNDTIYDDIYDAEEDFLDTQRTDGEYVLGVYRIVRGVPLYAIGLTPHTFLRHDYNTVIRYLRLYSVIKLFNAEVSILKIVKSIHVVTSTISFITTEAINKTIWLRLVQRHWRRAFRAFRARQMNCVWEMRGTSARLFPDIRRGGNVGLRGLMHEYKNKNI